MMILHGDALGTVDPNLENPIINDQYRIDFLQKHIEQLQLAITDGVDVFAFVHGQLLILSVHTVGGN